MITEGIFSVSYSGRMKGFSLIEVPCKGGFFNGVVFLDLVFAVLDLDLQVQASAEKNSQISSVKNVFGVLT